MVTSYILLKFNGLCIRRKQTLYDLFIFTFLQDGLEMASMFTHTTQFCVKRNAIPSVFLFHVQIVVFDATVSQ
jgi:hypothetical protein